MDESMENMAKKKVLLLGIDPKLIDVNLATTTGWDANRVKEVVQEANNKLMELGYEVQILHHNSKRRIGRSKRWRADWRSLNK
jgi:hypothetical protein